MIDLQDSIPKIQIPLNQVGIKGLKHPVTLIISNNEKISTFAEFNIYTDLSTKQRGAHMSRFAEILNQKNWELSVSSIKEFLLITKEKNNAKSSYVEINSHFFLPKTAPISKSKGLIDYKINFYAKLLNDKFDITFKIKIPVTTLCPCSKEISKYGAHNQRTFITIHIKTNEDIFLKDIINISEKKASSEIYSILKRADEKYLSEKAYENPKFVEDIAREIANDFNKNKKFISYQIEVESLESIHNHSAYAMIKS